MTRSTDNIVLESLECQKFRVEGDSSICVR